MCVCVCVGGGGGGLLYLLCPISNTLPQLEPSSLQPPSVLHHRHLIQTTCYRPPATDHLLQTTCYRPPDTDHLLQTTCYRPPATDHLLQTT